MNEEESNSKNESSGKAKTSYPPWVKRIGKLMVFFLILGCIFMSLGAMLLNSAIENALSGHGM